MLKKRWRRSLIIVSILITIGGFIVYRYTVRSNPVLPVDPSHLFTVNRSDLAQSVVATGKVEPIAKVEIKSKANGIIKELKVNLGDLIRPGQILAELDKEDLSARLREADAALLAAQSSLRAFEAEHARNNVEADSPDVTFARRNFERTEHLLKAGLIPQQNFEDAQKALEQATNRHNIAHSQLSVSEARVAQAAAAVQQAEAARARANEELNNATIRSPINGIVLSRNVEIGSPVSSIVNMGSNASLIMVLGDISKVYVRGNVDESDIGLVRLNQLARIKVETFKDRKFDGNVTQISPMGVEKDNVVSFEVRVSINNFTGELRANMTANAEIILDEHQNILLIPESAISYDAQHNATVELLDPTLPNGRRRVPIKPGISNGSRTEVLSGLREGQKIILP